MHFYVGTKWWQEVNLTPSDFTQRDKLPLPIRLQATWTESHCGCSGREKCRDNAKESNPGHPV